MEEIIAESRGLRLSRLDTERWVIYRIQGDEKPTQQDLLAILEALSRSADEVTKPVCVVLEKLQQPNSKILATLISLLTLKDGGERRVALAGATKGWLDMLDILGVRSRFLVVGSPEDLTEEG